MVNPMLKIAEVLVNAALSNVAEERVGSGANNSEFAPPNLLPCDFALICLLRD